MSSTESPTEPSTAAHPGRDPQQSHQQPSQHPASPDAAAPDGSTGEHSGAPGHNTLGIAGVVLRESLIVRARQSRMAFVGVVVVCLPIFIALGTELPVIRAVLWLGPMMVLLAWRVHIARQCLRQVETADAPTLQHFDARFRLNSILNQAVVGAGMWIVASAGPETTPYFITLAVCLFAIGALVNLNSDFASLRVSIPILMLQPIAYWFLQGATGIALGSSLLLVTLLMVSAGYRARNSFVESIAIRFEKNQLLRRLEEEKANAEDALAIAEEANRSKSLFMAAASHDLRQPLYAIRLLQDTLTLQDLPENVQRIVRQQGQAIETLSNLFDNLLDLSRFDSGRVEVHRSTVHVPELLEGLAQEFEPQCAKKGLQLRVHAATVWVDTDRELLTRLLRNLLSNAVRYTLRGSISLSARDAGDQVLLSVTDTGPGINEEDQQRVFQEFVQLKNPQRDRGHGVGLGLSIVQRIARLLDHPLDLQSAIDAGTRITIRVPVAVAPAFTGAPVTELPTAPETGGGARVWVVEDDPLVQSALGTYFDALDISHRIATSRAQLEGLRNREGWPDCVLLDDMLGEHETGLDLAHWLAHHLPKERLMLMTGNADPERLRVLEESGFNLVRKPVSATALGDWLAILQDDAPAAPRSGRPKAEVHPLPLRPN